MASIDRVMALAEELKKKKKDPNYQINQSMINVTDLATDIKGGNRESLQSFIEGDRGMFDAPIKTTVKMNNSNVKDPNKKWYQQVFSKGEFEDGYDFGDVTKTILGTGMDITQDIGKGIVSVIEAPVDVVTNATASVFNAFGKKDTAEKIRDFADIDLSEEISSSATNMNPAGIVYNILNGTPEKIINPTETTWDFDKSFSENAKNNYQKQFLEENVQDYESSSVSGYYADKTTELVGYALALIYGGQALTGATGTATTGITNSAGKTMLGASASGGNIGLTLNGVTLNVPTLAVMGGMSSGLEEANSKEDVTEAERWTKALSSGAIEGATEGLFGMFGMGGITNQTGEEIFDVMGTKAANLFKSKAGKILASAGIKATGETAEEFISYTLNHFTDNGIIDKMGEADFSTEWDWGELGETLALSFVSSMILQGGGDIINSNSAIAAAEEQLGRKLSSQEKATVTQASIEGTLEQQIKNIAEGRSSETGLTSNEQIIMNAEVERRKQEGSTLSDKELQEQIKTELEKGYISTDTIESTLGGSTYSQLQSIRDNQTNIQNQIAELENKANAEITVKEMERLQALREELSQTDTKTLESQLQSELGQKIKSDAYLQRSYQEKSNRSVKFEADLSKYDAKQQEVVQKAIDSGILNNTNRTHDFVDMVAKISSDKGISFDFTNNENLKKSGFAVEGKTVNGYIQDGNIAVNIDSPKALNRVVGHEITHVLEGTEFYTELQNAVKQYATTKGEYDTRLADLTKLYKDVKGANVENELTADLVGDYLFTDPDFVNNLSTEKPSLFKKVYDEIKHLYKMATAGSKEARELLKVKKAFDKAYRENIKGKPINETSVSEVATETTTEAVTETTSQVDSLGRELSAEQIAFFEDSKVRDAEGNLLVMYHGTGNEFDVFDINKSGQHYEDGWSAYGRGFYFTHDKATAEEYSKEAEGNNKHVKEVYLNVENPFYANEEVPELFEKYGLKPFINVTGRDFITQINVRDGRDASTKILQELGYDGVIETFGEKGIDEVVVFNENQAKYTDNKNPTNDPDMKYSLSEDTGVHYGDLGKARDTNYFAMSSTRRSTGHFGTGTYFVGSKESNVGTMKDNRPTHEVNFSDYYLFKPKNSTEAQQLHNLLRDINNKELNAFKLEDAEKLFNKSYEELYEAYKKTTTIAEDYNNLDTFELLTKDSLSTVFMKELGYNGIDVRGIEGFDNGTYGSVIYDLETKKSDTRYSLSEDTQYDYQSLRPKVRGGWTIEKIQKQLKQESSSVLNSKELDKFNNLDDLYENVYYHGSTSLHRNLKAGSTIKEEYRGGGYGEDYHSISLSKSKNIASNFTAMAHNGVVTPVILKKGANVIEMQDIEDSIELEDMLPQLWEQKVDAVKIGDWDIETRGYGEQEIVILNPRAIMTLPEGSEYYRVYKKPRFENMSKQEIANALNKRLGNMLSDPKNTQEARERISNIYNRFISDASLSLSNPNEQIAPSRNDVFGSDIRLEEAIAPLQEEIQALTETITELRNNMENAITNAIPDDAPVIDMGRANTEEDLPMLDQQRDASFDTLEAPSVMEESFNEERPLELYEKKSDVIKSLQDDFGLKQTEARKLFNSITAIEDFTVEDVRSFIDDYKEIKELTTDDVMKEVQKTIRNTRLDISHVKSQITDLKGFLNENMGRLRLVNNDGVSIDSFYNELSEMYPHYFSSDVVTEADQLERLSEFMHENPTTEVSYGNLGDAELNNIAANIYNRISNYQSLEASKDYSKEFNRVLKSGQIEAPLIEDASITEEIAPVREQSEAPNRAAFNEAVRESARVVERDLGYVPQNPTQESTYDEIAEILTEEPTTANERNQRQLAIIAANVLDKGLVFENVSLKNKNRELMAKWDYTLTSEARAQTAIGQGHYDNETGETISKSLNEIMEEVNNTGLTKQFYEYIYHKHNVDRMQLADKFEDMENKPVFGFDVTAEDSQEIVNQYEFSNPEFIDFAQDVYDYVNADRKLLVDNGVISQETADLWNKMYPHYVPIRREGHNGNAINVPLDTGRTGINAPIKKATGGSSNILPLFDTMAMRTLQTYRATAKNSFGVELMKTLGTKIESTTTNVDEVIDSVDAQESLLQENNGKPTFTVFENGEKITFSITKDMYDALKPLSDSSILSKTIKPLNIASSFHRGLLTQYNPVFAITNGVKDIQDMLINSQHAAKTYAKIPEAYAQVLKKGYWYQEYMANGGEHNSYFDSQDNTFQTENKGIKKLLDLPPLKQIAQLNDFIEIIPRLSEYIASREMGRSIEVSMLDAARVTTNFKAGGNLTKFLNRNGATFLNASVQGAMQQVRNVREAKANGIKGWANLATKFTIAGLPAILLNALLWEDDDEYEELSDYVKQNYYVVAKTDDGKFIRIPKGRTTAVLQDAVEQMKNFVTGDDEVDLASFIELFLTNLAPSNPIESNVFAPIIQAVNNETWYGEDLVPTRLQDLPAAEQYDESTDMFSRWLGENLNISPVKINYLLDQYSGGLGDLVLPMLTPEAESGDDSFLGNMFAPLKSKFTTDAVMNNQNVSDFYSMSEELTTNAKKSNATDEDVLKNKYINSVKAEMNELYKEKREIQNSSLPSSEKYNQVREVQSQINELSKNALNSYEDINIQGNYSSVGDREYHKDTKNEWKAINSDEAAALNSMGMSSYDKDNYFSAKNQITNVVKNYKNEKENMDTEDEEYEGEVSTLSGEKKVSIINAIKNAGLNDEQMAYLYDKYYASTEKLNTVVKTGIGMNAYLDLEAQNFTADVNAQGKTISGSKKTKIFDYINSMDIGFEQRVILAKMYYPSYDEYNYDIIDYLNNDDSISFSDMKEILETLDFKVYDDGTITWD